LIFARPVDPAATVDLLYDAAMDNSQRIENVILHALAGAEMRPLVLLVLVRKALGASLPIKVDLPRLVTTALRKLVASKCISDTDGIYSIVEGGLLGCRTQT